MSPPPPAPARSEADRPDGDPVIVTHALMPVAGGAIDIGQREHNEDHILLRPELGLFVLADGAGGHNAGNVASALATTTVANVFETSATSLGDRPEIDEFGLWTMARRLATAIQRANAEVIEVAKKTAKYQGMGTTLVALAFSPDGDIVHIAHVGDSRCYRLRDGLIEPLTTDHSLVVDVLETHPDVDDALLGRMPRHVVTRALGMEESVRVSMRTVRALAGDVFLLCSDGLSDVLEEGRIEELLGEGRSPDDHVKALIDAALAAGAQDNIAAVVVACEETEVVPKRRPSARPPHPPPPVMPAARRPMGSAPEIIIVGVETHVVPADSVSASLMDALGRFARLRQPSAPEVAHPKRARCADCGQPLESGATKCPTCGTAVT
ncbi:MAG TPA: protein phosphatase 2C domain-containing protein [Polyangiaceae bacterium]